MTLTYSVFAGEGRVTPNVVQNIVLQLAPNHTPIYSALLGLGLVRDATSAKVDAFQQSLPERRTAVNNGGAAYDATTTSIVVDSAAIIPVGSLLLAEATGEVLFVSAVNTGTNTLTVVRGVGKTGTGVAAAAGSVANDASLRVIGYADGEGGPVPTSLYTPPSPLSTWVQTFRKTLDLTGRANHINLLTGDERARLRMQKFYEIMEDIELSMLFGAGDDDTQNASGRVASTMRGLFNFGIGVDNVGGTMNQARWYQFCERAFQSGGPEKVMFAGPTLMTTLSTLYTNRLQIANLSDAVGLRMSQIETPFGLIQAVVHRGLSGAYAGQGIVVDPQYVELRPMQDKNGQPRGRVHLRENQQANGQDAVTDEWFAELAVLPTSLSPHHRITGVTGAA